MNKRAVGFLLPLYFVCLLALMGVLLFTVNYEISKDTPRIGESANTILEAYAQEDAINWYAQEAARLAILEVTKESVGTNFEEEVKNKYVGYLRQHPTRPIVVGVESEYSGNVFTLTSVGDVVLPLTYGNQPAQLRAGGVFTEWPISPQDNPRQVVSVFGKREVKSGSPNHPGIDIPAPEGSDVLAMFPGEVIHSSQEKNRVYIRSESGWTCGYVHVKPLVKIGDVVLAKQHIADVTDDGYGFHVDIRCYNENIVDTKVAAQQIFGSEHVALSTEYSTDTTYSAIAWSPYSSETPYLDPYCLLSSNVRKSVLSYYENNPEYVEQKVSGLAKKGLRKEGTVEEKLVETCDVYADAGIVSVTQSSVTDAFVEGLIDGIIQTEGTTCVLEPTRGEYSKFGITQRAYDGYYDVKSTQETLCELTEVQAREIYENDFFYGQRFDELPISIIPAIVDEGVNKGPGDAKRLLGEVLVETGFLEQQTSSIDALIPASQQAVAAGIDINRLFADKRIAEYKQLGKQPKYSDQVVESWINRAEKYAQEQSFADYATTDQLRGTGSYRFPLVVELVIPEELEESMKERLDHTYTFSACRIQDSACIQTQIRVNTGGEYDICTEYESQLKDAVSQCSEQLSSGCSCYIPVPERGNVTFTNTSAIVNGQEILTNWAQLGEDSFGRVWTAVNNTAYNELVYRWVLPNSLDSSDNVEVLSFDDLYIRMDIQNQDYILTFNNTNSTPLCEQTVEMKYCHIQEDLAFTVDHRIQ
jgi:lysozyme family protein/murein DD-endopeptidase MepM/ murein hydrolase activator NlpD